MQRELLNAPTGRPLQEACPANCVLDWWGGYTGEVSLRVMARKRVCWERLR